MIEIGSVSVNYCCLIVYVAKGKGEGRCGSDLYSNLKTVVHIGDVALDKSVPAPFPFAGTLGT